MQKAVIEHLQNAINTLDIMLRVERKLSPQTRRLAHGARRELLVAVDSLQGLPVATKVKELIMT